MLVQCEATLDQCISDISIVGLCRLMCVKSVRSPAGTVHCSDCLVSHTYVISPSYVIQCHDVSLHRHPLRHLASLIALLESRVGALLGLCVSLSLISILYYAR